MDVYVVILDKDGVEDPRGALPPPVRGYPQPFDGESAVRGWGDGRRFYGTSPASLEHARGFAERARQAWLARESINPETPANSG